MSSAAFSVESVSSSSYSGSVADVPEPDASLHVENQVSQLGRYLEFKS